MPDERRVQTRMTVHVARVDPHLMQVLVQSTCNRLATLLLVWRPDPCKRPARTQPHPLGHDHDARTGPRGIRRRPRGTVRRCVSSSWAHSRLPMATARSPSEVPSSGWSSRTCSEREPDRPRGPADRRRVGEETRRPPAGRSRRTSRGSEASSEPRPSRVGRRDTGSEPSPRSSTRSDSSRCFRRHGTTVSDHRRR